MASSSEAQADSIEPSALDIRTATVDDGAAIFRLVKESGALDENSCYAYLLLATHFSETCLVACDGDKLAGFVAGYVPPQQPDVIFVWQIGVDSNYRGQGLGRRLLSALVQNAMERGARFVEATITPSNRASIALFHGLASAGRWQLTTNTHFETRHFADPSHEKEMLVRIGPLKE